MAKLYPYQPVSTYSEERLAHKRHWDRIRQRECRSKKRKLTGELEEEIRSLKARFEALEEERDELAATVKRQSEAMERSERESQRLRSAVEAVCLSMRDSQSTLQAVLGHHGAPSATAASPTGSVQHPRRALRTPAELRVNDGPGDYNLPLGSRTASEISSLPDLSLSLQSLAQIPAADAPFTPSQVLDDELGDISIALTTAPSPDAAVIAGWDRIPVNTAPMGYIDYGILELERLCRHVPGQDVPMAELNAQAFPHISNLLNPEVPSHSLQHPLSSLVIDRMMKNMPLRTTINRLAAMWVICTILRWRICRTPETYTAMPEFMRPNEQQLTVPHPIWMDTIVWPEARRRVMEDFDLEKFEEFREDLSVDYVKHLSDLKNWTLSRSMVLKWPFLDGAVNVRD